MSTKAITTEQAQAVETLREWFPVGTTVTTVLRSVSRSGMSREIAVAAIVNGEIRNASRLVARVLDFKLAKDGDALKVSGAGMDMGFHVVYSLSSALHGDGYALSHRWF